MGRIPQLAQMACIWEVCAPKPGNVNRNHDFSDTRLEDFLLSAVSIGPAFENAVQSGVGRTIFQAVVDTRRYVRSNTNLGIILLLAPLVKAAFAVIGNSETDDLPPCEATNLRQSLRSVLQALTVEDARMAYAAIRLVEPGGLGHISKADVSDEPTITLLEVMNLAKERDAIAREYATGYAITYEFGLPAMKRALSETKDFSIAVVQAFLTILKEVPDTLISRKKGSEAARKVSRWADEVLTLGGAFTPQGKARMADMDRALRDSNHSMNPGTTADLTTAAVFLALLERTDSY